MDGYSVEMFVVVFLFFVCTRTEDLTKTCMHACSEYMVALRSKSRLGARNS